MLVASYWGEAQSSDLFAACGPALVVSSKCYPASLDGLIRTIYLLPQIVSQGLDLLINVQSDSALPSVSGDFPLIGPKLAPCYMRPSLETDVTTKQTRI